MLDYGALPPEINSGRMYFGPGPGPMLAAASAWDTLAAQLSAAAIGYGSAVSELAGHGWLGPASLSMAAAADPYVAWLHNTAAQAERTATQARAAAAAYELAFAMTVPPPVIAANRSLLLALVATNFFGQNTPAIAAAELHYTQMWLQDAVAMYSYAESSAIACDLAPFGEPPPTSNPAGPAAQSGAVGNATAPAALQGLVGPIDPLPAALAVIEHVPNVTNSVLSTSNAVTSGRGIYAINERLAFQEARDAETSMNLGSQLVSTAPSRIGGGPVSAAMARAAPVGKLSVPSGWLIAAPEIRPAALSVPYPGAGPASAVSPEMPPTSGSVFSQSLLGTLSRHGVDTPKHKSKPVIVRSPAAG